MCNILATAWVIDYFIAFDVPIYNTIYKGNYRVRQQESWLTVKKSDEAEYNSNLSPKQYSILVFWP